MASKVPVIIFYLTTDTAALAGRGKTDSIGDYDLTTVMIANVFLSVALTR
jgi:hypothetical protein